MNWVILNSYILIAIAKNIVGLLVAIILYRDL